MADQEVPMKPLPLPDEASQPFFDAAMKGTLMIMRCLECRTARTPSRSHCDNCLSDRFEWDQASGRGKVHTFGVMHQKYHPAFFPELPDASRSSRAERRASVPRSSGALRPRVPRS